MESIPQGLPIESWEARIKSEVLLFLGEKKRALESLRTVRPGVAFAQELNLFWEARRQFDRGELTEDAFLATAGGSRIKQWAVHYQIALLRLAAGDRHGAKLHFQKAVDTHVVWITQWMWCRVFLHRLENDNNWPRWIDAKK